MFVDCVPCVHLTVHLMLESQTAPLSFPVSFLILHYLQVTQTDTGMTLQCFLILHCKPIGNPDRGWNDPPMFLYKAETQAQQSPKRTALTQRVGMPQNYPSLATNSKGNKKTNNTVCLKKRQQCNIPIIIEPCSLSTYHIHKIAC